MPELFDFERVVANTRDAIRDYRQRRGTVHALIHPDNPIALAGIRQIDDTRFHVDEITLMSLDGAQGDRKIGPRDLHLTDKCPWADDAGYCCEDPLWDAPWDGLDAEASA